MSKKPIVMQNFFVLRAKVEKKNASKNYKWVTKTFLKLNVYLTYFLVEECSHNIEATTRTIYYLSKSGS